LHLRQAPRPKTVRPNFYTAKCGRHDDHIVDGNNKSSTAQAAIGRSPFFGRTYRLYSLHPHTAPIRGTPTRRTSSSYILYSPTIKRAMSTNSSVLGNRKRSISGGRRTHLGEHEMDGGHWTRHGQPSCDLPIAKSRTMPAYQSECGNRSRCNRWWNIEWAGRPMPKPSPDHLDRIAVRMV